MSMSVTPLQGTFFLLLLQIGRFKSLQVVTILITIVPEILVLATLFAQKSP